MKGTVSTMRRGCPSIKHFIPVTLLALSLGSLAGFLGGCGSGGSNPASSPLSAASNGSGRATFVIKWPQTGRLIPSGTQSIKVSIGQGTTVVTSQTVNRPAPPQTASVLTFPVLPVGTLIATATAYPQPNGAGIPLATGAMPLTITSGANTPITITMLSTINRIVVTPVAPGTTSLAAGQIIQVIATALDANGNVVPLASGSTLSFVSDNPTVASVTPVVDAGGQTTAVSNVTAGNTSGVANITFTYTEAGVGVDGATKTGTLQVQVLASTGLNGARFVYVTNSGSNTVTAYTVGRFTGVLTVSGQAVASGTSPQGLGVAATGQFVYVVNSVSNSVSGYAINNVQGGLTPFSSILGAPFPTGANPVSIAVAPQGNFIYVANNGSNTISQFSIDPNTGGLTTIGAAISTSGPTVQGLSPQAVVVDPTSRFVFTANSASNNVSAFSIIPGNGALIPTGDPVATGGVSPQSLAVDPTGKYLYVTNLGGNSVTVFSIDAGPTGTGALTSLTAYPTGIGPVAIAVSNNLVFVANRDSNSVTVFAASANGVLTQVGSPTPTGSRPVSLTVDPLGRNLYVTNFLSNTVSEFNISPATGALTPLSPPTVASGAGPASIITTTGASGNLTVSAN